MDAFVQHWQLALGCFVVGYALAMGIHGKRGTAQPMPPRMDISEDAIEAALRGGQKIEAIKLCRQKYGYDLKTALDEINAMSVRLGLRV